MLLHGYGANEHDLLALSDHLDARLRTVAIRAPLALDMGGYAWFPLEVTPVGVSVDFSTGERVRDELMDFIADLQNHNGNGGDNTYLLGFSQGGAMALGTMLRWPTLVAGVAFLSGLWLRELMPREEEILAQLKDKPILQAHGTYDPLIPIHKAHASRDLLQELPVKLSYHEFGMGHEINGDCLHTVRTWLEEQLA